MPRHAQPAGRDNRQRRRAAHWQLFIAVPRQPLPCLLRPLGQGGEASPLLLPLRRRHGLHGRNQGGATGALCRGSDIPAGQAAPAREGQLADIPRSKPPRGQDRTRGGLRRLRFLPRTEAATKEHQEEPVQKSSTAGEAQPAPFNERVQNRNSFMARLVQVQRFKKPIKETF